MSRNSRIKEVSLGMGVLGLCLVGYFILQPQVITEEEAVASVKKAYPAFTDYPSNNLPIKRVEVVPELEGWRVGMYVEGSGVHGILKADCFLVTKDGTATQTGFWNGEGSAQNINLMTCTPKE